MATKETKAVLRGEYGQTVKPMSQEVIDKVIPGEEKLPAVTLICSTMRWISWKAK